MDHPMSAEMAVMRRSMLPGLLRAVARNQAHQRADGGLFEIGRTYAPQPDGQAIERPLARRRALGPRRHRGAGGRAPRPVDVYTATGLADALARAAGVAARAAARTPPPYFHPVRQARLLAGEAVVGWAAEMHPLVLRELRGGGPGRRGRARPRARCSRARRGAPQYEDLLTVPVSHPRPRAGGGRGRPGRRPGRGGARGRRAPACATCASSTATRASRWGRAT